MGNCFSSAPAAEPLPVGRGKALKITDVVLQPEDDVRKYYTFDKILGKGNFGVVHQVYDKVTREPCACKSIAKRKLLTPEDVEDVRREVQIMNHLSGNKNIVQLKRTFEDKNYIHLIMEVCNGGELFERIAEKGHFSEKSAADVMRTIVSVVHHCHTMNVVHRDLKPENFLLSIKGRDGILKATDFGLSRFFKDGEHLDEIVGSPFYVAPEVLRKNYSKEADIWSCGVILYILLCGWPPFHGDSTQAIFKAVLNSPLDLKADPWGRVSEHAKDIVRKMLIRDPKKRLTADQVLHHPWMKENGLASDEPFVPEVLTRMRQFTKMNNLKKEALKVIASHLPTIELTGMKEMFEEIDADHSGAITIDELRKGLATKGANVDMAELKKLLDNMDVDGNSKIDYSEFLAATMHSNKLNREDNMIMAFKHFDTDGSGFITTDELLSAMANVGGATEEVTRILAEADRNGDGKLSYEEFALMMRATDAEALRSTTAELQSQMAAKAAKAGAPDKDGSGRYGQSCAEGNVKRSSNNATPPRAVPYIAH